MSGEGRGCEHTEQGGWARAAPGPNAKGELSGVERTGGGQG